MGHLSGMYVFIVLSYSNTAVMMSCHHERVVRTELPACGPLHGCLYGMLAHAGFGTDA